MWILLARNSATYNDYIVMPRSLLAVSGAGAAWPDCNSIISSHLHCRLHYKSWERLHDCPDAWSMLTTCLPETTGGDAPVPIWSADAVVLAGRWSAQQVDCAVEMITLPALMGQASPTVVVPAHSDVPEFGLEERGRVRLWRAAAASLSRVADRTGGLLTVNGTRVCVRERDNDAPAGAVSDEQWNVLRRVLPPEPIRSRRGRSFNPRPYFEGVLWHERTGRPWAQLPEGIAHFKAVLWNQARWRKDGTLDALFKLLHPYEELSADREISDATWGLIDNVLQSSGGSYRKAHARWRDRRQILEGILYKFRTGQAWGNLPDYFGPGDTLRYTFRRWVSDGTWDLLSAAVEKAPEAERLTTIIAAATRPAARGTLGCSGPAAARLLVLKDGTGVRSWSSVTSLRHATERGAC
ncbi:transposase [Streptomyces sp. NPDC057552]|uniref:transposase n=1 Tax=Streptomyces sp. NPDC057552 TaxID=3350537 RepID=UPI003679F8C9